MTNLFTNKVSNFSCIDLLNINEEELKNLFLIKSFQPIIEEYLKHVYISLREGCYKNSHNPHIVYTNNNYILGSRDCFNRKFEFSLVGIEFLEKREATKKITSREINNLVEKLESKKSLVLDSELISLSSLFSESFNINEEINSINGHLLIPDIYTMEDLRNKFTIATNFFCDTDYQILRNLLLQEIYYINELPALFIFKDNNGKRKEGWNAQYLAALRHLNPINKKLQISKSKLLDAILDKINYYGITTLSEDELFFLANY